MKGMEVDTEQESMLITDYDSVLLKLFAPLD